MRALGHSKERKTNLVLRYPMCPNVDALTQHRYCDIGAKDVKEALTMVARRFVF